MIRSWDQIARRSNHSPIESSTSLPHDTISLHYNFPPFHLDPSSSSPSFCFRNFASAAFPPRLAVNRAEFTWDSSPLSPISSSLLHLRTTLHSTSKTLSSAFPLFIAEGAEVVVVVVVGGEADSSSNRCFCEYRRHPTAHPVLPLVPGVRMSVSPPRNLRPRLHPSVPLSDRESASARRSFCASRIERLSPKEDCLNFIFWSCRRVCDHFRGIHPHHAPPRAPCVRACVCV